MKGTSKLWYTSPAEQWVEALPLGNGRIGAMVFGGVHEEKLALNEDTLWSGYPRRYRRENAPQHIAEAQRLVREGRLAEAQQLIEKNVTSNFSQAYMPLGDMHIRFLDLAGDVQHYTRTLDIENGVHTVEFDCAGVHYVREAFISQPDQALVLRFSADRPGCISFDMELDTQLRRLEESCVEGEFGHVETVLRAVCPSNADPHYAAQDEPIRYDMLPGERGVRFCALVQTNFFGGDGGKGDCRACVREADEAVIRFFVRTSFNGCDKHPELQGKCPEEDVRADQKAARSLPYAQLRSRHIEDFSAIMRRCDFHLNAPREDLPTLERLRAFRDTQDDPALYELLFQYGRYLTAAASRPGTQATNLQGIWNESLLPPWSSNYTININTEMNYWPAEPTNLSEMTEPLFDLIEGLCANGRQTAQDFYGARGSVSHHNADLWRHTTPVGLNQAGSQVWAFWPMSLGWLSRHLFDHFLYTNDLDFLKNRAMPVLREAALFYCDALKDDGRGYLSIYPATSPENTFLYEGAKVSGAANATMQEAIIREVFANYLKGLEILGEEDELSGTILEKTQKLRPYAIGSKGQLLEWTEEYEEAEPHHRHLSHLYPFHPGTQISEKTPELMQAVRRSLELRGDDGTGWSLGWKINMWARMNDGDHALQLIKMQLRLVGDSKVVYTKGGGTYPNMFDAHPPFQIDGNYGATAGICEMLLRSREEDEQYTVELLPALPASWTDGEITGVKTMGGLTVDIRFAKGKLAEAHVRAESAPYRPVAVRYAGATLALVTGPCELTLRP
ncbi:MAG: glycoside hydrolase family 95 protein [Eubacteriales bacterium]|nr:glycoside hydrolase family 95 protein [Eubacteriales bacterium]